MKVLFVLSILALLAACSTDSSTSGGSNTMPLGTAMSGVSLSGVLTGKTLYVLDAPINPSGCWIDSQFWNGTELFVGITSIDWTSLNNGSLHYNTSCTPSPGFVPQSSPGATGNFNIYRAVVNNGAWILTNSSLNVAQTASLSALKLSGTSGAFVKYEKTSGNGNIYLTTRSGTDTYAGTIAFSQNSSNCNDDNPAFGSSTSQLIFTSSRTNAAGSSCSGSGLKTFWSSTSSAGAWQTPVALTIPSSTYSVDQAWVDATGANLYWTTSGYDCSGPVTTCIKTASGAGTTFTTTPQQIATPISLGSWPTSGAMFVSDIGQFTLSGRTAFAVCGVTYFVGSNATSGLTTLNSTSVRQGVNGANPPYNYYHTDFRTCVIQ